MFTIRHLFLRLNDRKQRDLKKRWQLRNSYLCGRTDLSRSEKRGKSSVTKKMLIDLAGCLQLNAFPFPTLPPRPALLAGS
ncbi:uncharacterized protein N7473_013198 [Penicillium subrubescens]|uniref:uncharacterized protein n=1 Tax=Penicillium subrubescens TaxID=1316194 RepID=UPI0025459B3D|nr:uncharacterized protein N7473_013198 [Penicillium subrubescens]KAJ5873639.1 hypothetical protein N7473_013198 [Penicillium subrubescens]